MPLTYSIYAAPRADKKRADGRLPVTLFLRVGGNISKLTTGKYIDPKDWDKKKRSPKKINKQLIALATYLNQRMSDFELFMQMQQNMGKAITSTLALSFFKENKTINFFAYCDQQIALMENDLSYNTIKSYRSTVKIIKEFNPKLDFGDIDTAMLHKFDHYLRNDRGNTRNGAWPKLKNLRSILTKSCIDGLMKDNPFKAFKIKSTEVRREFLSIAEINKLMALEIPSEEAILHLVRDLFLFGAFTALRFSDVVNLKVNNINLEREPILVLKVIKTNRPLVIPLSAEALNIIQKYIIVDEKNYNKIVFPKITGQAVNRNLKDLAKMAGINKSLSFHSSRHSCASNMLEAGVPLVVIKEILGHRSISETQIYAKTMPSELIRYSNQLNQLYNK